LEYKLPCGRLVFAKRFVSGAAPALMICPFNSGEALQRVGLRSMSLMQVWLASFIVSLILATTTASAVVPPAEKLQPSRVEVGIWLSGIHSVDFVNGSFGAEFYMWWISPDADFRPFETFQILNGRQWTVRSVNRRILPDGLFHTSGIVSVTGNHDWQLGNFPFDRQSLKLIIETSQTASELKLVPNEKKSMVSDFMHVEGFQVLGLKLDEKVEKYTTDFGIKGSSGDEFSRLVVTVNLKRESGRLVVAMLIGFIVANIIAFMTYAIHVSNLSIRASMAGSAIFAAVGNMYSINTVLNPAAGSLLVDRFAVGTFVVIVAALLNSIVVERLVTKGRSSPAHTVNRVTFYVVLSLSLLYYTVAFVQALRGPS
jgi:hypothetical protein